MVLRGELAIDQPDEFYNRLIDCVQAVGEAKVPLFNARLILLLANQIGNRGVLDAALLKAREGL